MEMFSLFNLLNDRHSLGEWVFAPGHRFSCSSRRVMGLDVAIVNRHGEILSQINRPRGNLCEIFSESFAVRFVGQRQPRNVAISKVLYLKPDVEVGVHGFNNSTTFESGFARQSR